MLLVGVATEWLNKSLAVSLMLITTWQGWMQMTTAVNTLATGEAGPPAIRAGDQDNIST